MSWSLNEPPKLWALYDTGSTTPCKQCSSAGLNLQTTLATALSLQHPVLHTLNKRSMQGSGFFHDSGLPQFKFPRGCPGYPYRTNVLLCIIFLYPPALILAKGFSSPQMPTPATSFLRPPLNTNTSAVLATTPYAINSQPETRVSVGRSSASAAYPSPARRETRKSQRSCRY